MATTPKENYSNIQTLSFDAVIVGGGGSGNEGGNGGGGAKPGAGGDK